MIDEKKLIERLQKCIRVSDDANFTNGLLSAIDIVNQQPKIGEWIPCSERLPEEKGWYLVFAKGQRPFVAFFKGKTFPLNNHYHEIIAWMPLPEPYEVDDHEQVD